MSHDTPDEIAARLARRRKKPSWGETALIIAVLVLILGGIFGGFGYVAVSIWKSRPRTAASPQPVLTGLAAASPYRIEANCEDAVRRRLKAPATAKFTPISRAAYNGEGWAYSGVVDSENAFSALLRTGFTCVVNGQSEQDAQVSVALE